jgi:hypothetical protein
MIPQRALFQRCHFSMVKPWESFPKGLGITIEGGWTRRESASRYAVLSIVNPQESLSGGSGVISKKKIFHGELTISNSISQQQIYVRIHRENKMLPPRDLGDQRPATKNNISQWQTHQSTFQRIERRWAHRALKFHLSAVGTSSQNLGCIRYYL